MKIIAEAPSNIALIKYMGKVKGSDRNRPTNSSLSYTLNHLRTRVEIEAHSGNYDEWQALEAEGWIPNRLSEWGRKRYLAHFEFLKQKLGIEGRYLVRSANNFPSDCGIASSASSFAALTQATYELAQKLKPETDLPLEKVAELSRLGSGSSIRSFLGPFAMWGADGVEKVELPYERWIHQVVIVDGEKKAIGSSEAHQMVPSSYLFEGRPARADKRLKELIAALREQNWKSAYEIVWEEFWDMHVLFETSRPAFGYLKAETLEVLRQIQNLWNERKDGPLVTLDAGPNVHLMFREDQKALAAEMKSMFARYRVFDSEQ